MLWWIRRALRLGRGRALEGEARAQAMLDSALDAIVVMDAAGRVVEWNAGAKRTFGYDRSEALGRLMADLIVPEALRSRHVEGLARYVRTGATTILGRRIELPARRADGTEFPAELTVVRVGVAGPPLFTGFIRDLSERKRAEEALRLSEERLRTLAESSTDIVYRYRILPTPGFEYVSSAATKVLGYTPEEHYADPQLMYRIVHPGDRHLLAGLVGRGTYGRPVQLRWVRRDGTIVSVEHRDTPIRDEHGNIIAVHGIGRDVTDRQRGESEQRALAEVGGVLASTLDPEEIMTRVAEVAVGSLAECCIVHLVAGEGVARFARAVLAARADADGEVARALGRAAARRTDPPPLMGKLLESGLPALSSELQPPDLAALASVPEDVALLRELRAVSYMGLPLVARGRLVGALVLISSDPQRHYDQRELGLAREIAHRISLAVENTRLYRVAQQAIRAREDLLGVVAHDLRNPLATVQMAAASITRKLPGDDAWSSIRQAADMIRRSTERANELIQDLLDVARMEAGSFVVERAPVPVHGLVAEVAETFALMASEASLRLTTDVAAALPPVLADRSMVLRVLSNIVGNAIKFTPAGGSIRVGAASRDGEVAFLVADTGPGIAADELPRLYDRFWQGQRGDRRGAGLGLPIAKGIVEAHGGRLWVDSTPGLGSTFTFTLPAAPVVDAHRAETAPHAP